MCSFAACECCRTHKKTPSLFKDKRLPAVPPCFTHNMCALCRVPSHSSPITLASRLNYSESLCISDQLNFAADCALHAEHSFRLALRGPFTETAFIRIPPPRTLWEIVPQFYFLVVGLSIDLMSVYYHFSLVVSMGFEQLCSGFPVNNANEASFHI